MAWVASRLPARTWQRLAWPLLLVGFVGLGLVLVKGRSVNGNQNWVRIGGLTLQPAEAVKLALVVWTGTVLARKHQLLDRAEHLLVPVLPVAALLLGLVLAGHDLGTALILMALVAALLFTAGAPLRLFVWAGAAAGLLVGMLVVGSDNRMARIHLWLGGGGGDYLGTGWQSQHGLWALATGGWWGVGLGASREKWSWLPEAHNDFIFAIIGEELGLIGTLAVLALFALLAVGLFRLVLCAEDLFVKIATGGVLAWVLGQALINIGAVIGVLPVVGVPLPLVSSGGSALMTTLVALGMVLGFARRVPGAPEALASRPSAVRRSLAVLPGRSVLTGRPAAAGRVGRPGPARTPGRRRKGRSRGGGAG
jgi:cell division protein FtsW